MKKYLLFLTTFLLTVCFLVINTKGARAGTSENVSGWAWSENIGWISFNNTSGGGSVNYGVNIDSSTGVFSGYAWSENIGWITFNESDLSGCPVAPCQAWVDISCPEDQCLIYGWARVVAHNGDWPGGWIRLRDANYGLWIDPTLSPAEFKGWAWSDFNIGWISFNCQNQGVCGTSDYKVVTSFAFNRPPEARNLSVTQGDYCEAPYPPVFLSWEFYDSDPGDTQSAYWIQVDNNSGFSSPEVDSGKVSSSSQTYAPANLSYNTTYYWRVKVWDSEDAESEWATGPSFTTEVHHPSPDFTWSPSRPAIGESVQFTDQSQAFGGATITSWFWTFENGDPLTSSEQNPSVIFTAMGPENQNEVTLTVTDSNANSCSVSKFVGVTFPLPEWKEIVPF